MQDFQEDEKKNHDRIMLVEDDTTITHVLKRQLERWGYEVFDTVDFEHVMEAFAGWKPDLVLMDLTLPFFNGYYRLFAYKKLHCPTGGNKLTYYGGKCRTFYPHSHFKYKF